MNLSLDALCSLSVCSFGCGETSLYHTHFYASSCCGNFSAEECQQFNDEVDASRCRSEFLISSTV
jgi:hypothetical protein